LSTRGPTRADRGRGTDQRSPQPHQYRLRLRALEKNALGTILCSGDYPHTRNRQAGDLGEQRAKRAVGLTFHRGSVDLYLDSVPEQSGDALT